METIQLDDFLSDGIIKEDEFRNQVKTINWESFRDKQVMIKGCASVPVPTWAYLIISAKLSNYAKKIYFGEPWLCQRTCSNMGIFNHIS